MADGVDYSIVGMGDLISKLESIKEDTRRRGGRFALRRAAQVIRDQARENASRLDDPRTREDIEKNIVERWSSRLHKRTGDLGFRVGVLGGAKGAATSVGEMPAKGRANPGGDTFYWRFLEFGTSHSRAYPFLRPAVDQVGMEPLNVFMIEYNKAIDRAVKRAQKKGETA